MATAATDGPAAVLCLPTFELRQGVLEGHEGTGRVAGWLGPEGAGKGRGTRHKAMAGSQAGGRAGGASGASGR